jgi:hypothetical protein
LLTVGLVSFGLACSQSDTSTDGAVGDAVFDQRDALDDPGGTDADASAPFSEITAAFVTPNAAMIRWWPASKPLGFDRYELWYGRDRTAVQQARSPAQRWSRDDDINLGDFYRMAAQVISRTMLLRLEAETTYHAMLRVVSADARELARSEAISFSTPAVPSTGAIDLYRDEIIATELGSYNGPEGISSNNVNPYAGGEAIEVTIPDDRDGDGLSFTYGGLDLSLAELSEAAFEQAYLELAIACSGGDVDYAEIYLGGSASDVSLQFSWPDYLVCSSTYRLFQVPLSAFFDKEDNAATYAMFGEKVGDTLTKLRIWGKWPAGKVYYDEMRIIF